MFKKIIGILIVVLGLCLAFMAFTIKTEAPFINEKLANAVWLEGDNFNPENDGQLVIMNLDPHELGNAFDEDLKLEFNWPMVVRHAEVFIYNEAEEFEWVELTDSEILAPSEGFISLNLNAGRIELEPSYAKNIISEHAPLSLLSEECYELAAEVWNIEYDDATGIEYLTNANDLAFFDNLDDDLTSDVAKNLNCIRIYYDLVNPHQELLTIVGIQEGQVLRHDESLDILPVYTDVESLDDLLETSDSDSMWGTFGLLFMATVCLILGLGQMGIIKLPHVKSEKELIEEEVEREYADKE